MEIVENVMENHIKCEIKDIQEFKWCLDSVKFPTGPKKFNVSASPRLTALGRHFFRADLGHHPEEPLAVGDHND